MQVLITSAASPPAGGQGFANGQDPESVDANGVENVVKRAQEVLPASERTKQVFIEASDLSTWESRDDVIMGGKSSSALSVEEGQTGVLHTRTCPPHRLAEPHSPGSCSDPRLLSVPCSEAPVATWPTS